MYPELSPVVRVYAPLGPDLIDYLSRIARYNRRPQAATDWRLDVHAGPDFLDRIRDEPPGGVAIFSGRNCGKIDRIIAALEAGLHVLADKPAIIEPADLLRLEAALTMTNEQQLVLADMMTGRHNTLVRLLQALRRDPKVFGDPVPGTDDEPGVLLSGVHYLRKVVAGLPNPRPTWYFDVTEQGEGLADTGVHLVDRVHEMLFPEQPLDWQRDIEILAASRWPTPVSPSQFHELTGEGKWLDASHRGSAAMCWNIYATDVSIIGCAAFTSGWRCGGIGRPSRATIRITRFTAVPAAGLRCGRVPQNAFGRSYTSCRMRISVRRCSGALLSCSRATPGLPWRLLDRNGGSRYPRRYGSAMTPLSGPLPVAFSRVSPSRRRCRRERDPIYSQNTG
jgi:hypothetical protein